MTVEILDRMILIIKSLPDNRGARGLCYSIRHNEPSLEFELEERLKLLMSWDVNENHYCWPLDKQGDAERIKFLEDWKDELKQAK